LGFLGETIMKHSNELKQLAGALSKAQSEMSGAKKSAKNPFFKSNYANLEEVINCIKDPFANHGLSFLQFPVSADGFAGVETTIMHESGEWVSNEFMLKCAKNDPQGMGSAITYARRYGLQSAVGLPSEDDDGNAATKRSQPAQQAKPTPIQAAPSLPAINTVDVTIIDYAKAGALHTVTLAAGGKTIEAKTSDNEIGGLAEFNKGKTASAGLQQTAKGVKLATLVIK